MQPRRLALPKLDTDWNDTVAAPLRRSWYRPIRELPLIFTKAILKNRSRLNPIELVRCPSGKLAVTQALRPVCVRLLGADKLHGSLHSHLFVQRVPMEAQCSSRVLGKFAPLAALRVRKEHK